MELMASRRSVMRCEQSLQTWCAFGFVDVAVTNAVTRPVPFIFYFVPVKEVAAAESWRNFNADMVVYDRFSVY